MAFLFFLYILVWLAATNALVVWFKSSMSLYIMKIFRILPDEIMTNEDANTYLIVNKGKIGELLSCPVCLSHWFVALFAGLLVVFTSLVSWPFIFLCIVTLPFLSTSVLNKWH